MPDKMSYDEWLVELKRVSMTRGYGADVEFCRKSWRTYYDADLTPDDALTEDESYE